MRNEISLNDGWLFFKPSDSAAGIPVTLPHTWNNEDGQDGGNDYYRGTCRYERTLKGPALTGGGRAWLEFQGAAMTAEVWFNGQKLSRHEGGYSTFRVDITEHLKDENTLTISVDNGENDAVYPQKADFTFYGGLYREVKLITVPKAHFSLGYFGATGLRVTPKISGDDARVELEAWAENAEGLTVEFCIEGAGTATGTVESGRAHAHILIEGARFWDGLHDPYLYAASAALEGGDKVEARFGCRSFQIDPERGFLLNGRPYPLRGVSRHQDRRGAGSALTRPMHEEDMKILCELGANTVRLAHYQHDAYFYDLCDEKGIVVWAEIPYITEHMQNGLANTLSQMQELIVQNYNHPCVACWGLSNEITAVGGATEEILENHRRLNDLCHRLDPTRPTAMANVFMLETDSPLLEIPDVNSYNLYFGWYLGELVENDRFFDAYHAKYPDRCMGLSEYGADANPRFQASAPERGDYSEGYQCLYHEHMLAMIETRPWLWATHVWNLFDFAADGRDEGGEHGVNQKGLVSMDRRLKKDAFYLYKAHWSKENFVHLCGARYVERAEEQTEVKVYSNQSEVALYVDGRLFETQKGRFIFRFSVPLSGYHRIEARAGKFTDSILIRRADAPNPVYRLAKDGGLINWFEQNDPAYCSVSDTLGSLLAHPQAGAVVGQLMARASASRGDVAESVKDNPALQRMMAGMPLLSLLKQAGEDTVPPTQIKALNAMLQKIKKEI